MSSLPPSRGDCKLKDQNKGYTQEITFSESTGNTALKSSFRKPPPPPTSQAGALQRDALPDLPAPTPLLWGRPCTRRRLLDSSLSCPSATSLTRVTVRNEIWGQQAQLEGDQGFAMASEGSWRGCEPQRGHQSCESHRQPLALPVSGWLVRPHTCTHPSEDQHQCSVSIQNKEGDASQH